MIQNYNDVSPLTKYVPSALIGPYYIQLKQ
nr:MAG TPA: hypothetical protein [Caudoviricetes sp.]